MRLSVVLPVLNEETFLPLYLDSVTKYADEVIIIDGGSKDKSLEVIKSYQKKFNVRLFEQSQSGLPYTDDWNESEVRNFLLDQAKGEWIAAIDVDEIFDDNIRTVLPRLLSQKSKNILEFPFVDFWKDPWTIRINAQGDNAWSNSKIRIWRNNIGIRYQNQKHHCGLELNGQSIFDFPRHLVKETTLYHYHYALGGGIKFNDNRRLDVNMLYNTGEPDWNYKHGRYEILTKKFNGNHPDVIQRYLSNQ
jgi:glycosyltransferase involved in cell wall biosynthesis